MFIFIVMLLGMSFNMVNVGVFTDGYCLYMSICISSLMLWGCLC